MSLEAFFDVMSAMSNNVDTIVGEQGGAFAKFALDQIFPSVAVLMMALPVMNSLITDNGFVDMVSDWIRSLFFIMAIWAILTNWGVVAGAIKSLNEEILSISATSLSGGTANDPVSLATSVITPSMDKITDVAIGNISIKAMADDVKKRADAVAAAKKD